MTDNKKVQDLTMNTLNVLINYCEEHDLRYYFTGGALIGSFAIKALYRGMMTLI